MNRTGVAGDLTGVGMSSWTVIDGLATGNSQANEDPNGGNSTAVVDLRHLCWPWPT